MRGWITFKVKPKWGEVTEKPPILSDNQISWSEIQNKPLLPLILTGTSSSLQGGISSVAHGLQVNKITGIIALLNYNFPASGFIPENYSYNSGYYFDIFLDATNISIFNHPNNSSNILSKPFKITVFYVP